MFDIRSAAIDSIEQKLAKNERSFVQSCDGGQAKSFIKSFTVFRSPPGKAGFALPSLRLQSQVGSSNVKIRLSAVADHCSFLTMVGLWRMTEIDLDALCRR